MGEAMKGALRIRADAALEVLAAEAGRSVSVYWGYNVVG
jgi:hypothetical protein